MFDKITELNERTDVLKSEIEMLTKALEEKKKELDEIGVKLDKCLHIKRCKFCDKVINDKFKIATAYKFNFGTNSVDCINHIVCVDCFKSISYK